MDPRRVASVVVAAGVVVAGGCGPAAAPRPPAPDPSTLLAPLPRSGAFNTDRFAGVSVCVRCHTAGDHAMRDARGRDVSPVTDANASIMALASRDPYYLAALQRELEHVPATTTAADATALCVRCHAPVGYAEARATNATLTVAELEFGTSQLAGLAREGVGCAGCHALVSDGLGGEASFTGKQPLSLERISYGVLTAPVDDAMRAMIQQRAVPSPHVGTSELCASCHTVIVPALGGGPDIAEQTTYLEWKGSRFASGDAARSCQDCHLAQLADATPFATRPPTSIPRVGFRRHAIRGGNAYLLARLAAHGDWLGAAATPEQLADAAADTAAFLTTAASIAIAPASDGAAITVTNLTGHKLPTGYPTRRMWLHVVARDRGGAIVLESGKAVAGAIVGANGARLDARGAVMPHVARIASANDACVWEAVPVGADGHRTHLLLGTAKLAKDDRILPAGDAADADPRTRPIGVDGDGGFGPGHATVTVVLPAAAATVDVELLYQSIPPETLESYISKHGARPDSLEGARFLAIADVAPEPQVIARAAWKR